MAKRKLTDVFIKSVQTDKRIEIFDTDTTGLALRVTPTGHKSFFYRYRYGDKIKRYTIGKYSPPALTLKKARDKAKELRVQVNNGKDPQGEKQKQKYVQPPLTFKKLAQKYKATSLPTLRDKTQTEHERIIDNELIPAFGKMPASELTKTQIISFLDKKAIDNDKKIMANRIRARLHSIFEFGLDKQIVDHNPVTKIKSYPEGSGRERFFSEKEIKKLWEAFGVVNEPAGSLMKMLLLTGQRKTETMNMMWEDIRHEKRKNFSGLVWIIPKDLAKSHRLHLVPLSHLAKNVLEQMRIVNGAKSYVFASPVLNDSSITDISRSIKEVRTKSKVKDFKLHDLRRTVSTYLAELGVPQEVNSKILNHKTGGGGSQVTRLYNRYEYIKERQIALNKWADKLQSIIASENEEVSIL